MRYPPALTFTPGVSWMYISFALLITLILIAACAVSMPASGQFSVKTGLFLACATLAVIFLLCDAFRRQKGSLHFTQGTWQWEHGEQKIAGTCALHLDLQTYILVSFTATSANNKLFPKTTQWFHLEARHADHAAPQSMAGGWLALRRAIHCPMEPTNEAVAA